jgi:predicted nucleic acid-binding protein
MKTSILVDTNVLVDVMTFSSTWFEWFRAALKLAVEQSRVVVNPIVYAEIGTRFESAEELDSQYFMRFMEREEVPWSAAFLAGKAHLQYRRLGGTKLTTLSDFFIGAHALVSGHYLLTRDSRRFETYFPAVKVISPETAP